MGRKEHWESMYNNTAYDNVSWYQDEPTISLSLIKGLPLENDGAIIDAGGGASALVDFLLEAGFKNLTVVDISSSALEHAKNRRGGKKQLVSWKVEDVTNFESQEEFQLWHDRAVFHFLTAESDRKKYRKVLEKSVKDGSYVIIAAFAIDGPVKCSGLDIVQYDAEKLQQEIGEKFKLVEQRPENHITPAGDEQSFVYYLFTKNT